MKSIRWDCFSRWFSSHSPLHNPLDGKPIVLFLDELNHARPEILQTIMDLALNRTLAGLQLPEGSRIISAVNEGEQYMVEVAGPKIEKMEESLRKTQKDVNAALERPLELGEEAVSSFIAQIDAPIS